MKKLFFISGLLFALFITPLISYTQSNSLKSANALYDNLAFNEAIPWYVEVLQTDSANAEALIKLANCYRLTNNNPKAMETYAKVVKLPSALPIHTLYYAQELMTAGRYEEAKTLMKNYTEDDRGGVFFLSIENMKKFFRQKDNYDIKKADFNSNRNDYSPALWRNSIVFTSSRERANLVTYKSAWTGHYYDALYITKRTSDSSYSKPQLLNKELQSRYNMATARFSNDGKHMYFTQNNVVNNEDVRDSTGKINLKIFQATLGDNEKFGDLKDFFYNSDAYNCAHPALNSDGTMLYFSSDMPGGFGGMDIYVSFKKDSIWTAPVNLGPNYNSAGNELFPYIFEDNILYVSSNGFEGMGGLDIYKVRLDNKGIPVGRLMNIGAPINTPFDDFGIMLYPEGKTGFYSSNFGNTDNVDDIYEFAILKPVDMIINGTVTDNATNQVISGAKMMLSDKDKTDFEEVTTDEYGKYSFLAAYGVHYTLSCIRDTYSDVAKTLTDTETSEITVDFALDKKLLYQLMVSVADNQDNKPVANVKIEMYNYNTSETNVYNTASDGSFVYDLSYRSTGENAKFRITLSKEDYISKTIEWQHSFDKTQNIVLNETIKKAQIGTSLDDFIALNPIYFNFNKSNIRPDAAIELDKVVAFLKQNPQISIELSSHTDCRGNASYNQTLSENRARASKNYIVSKGIAKNRVKAKGYGEKKLANDCDCRRNVAAPCPNEVHALNRRTEFKIIQIDKSGK